MAADSGISASRNGRNGHTLARLMDEMRRKEIGLRLQQLRESAALTQPQAAERAGVGLRTYQGWEYGEAGTDLEQYEKLAEIFGADVREILGTESGEPPWVEQIQAELNELRTGLVAAIGVMLDDAEQEAEAAERRAEGKGPEAARHEPERVRRLEAARQWVERQPHTPNGG